MNTAEVEAALSSSTDNAAEAANKAAADNSSSDATAAAVPAEKTEEPAGPPPAWTVQPGGRIGFSVGNDGETISGEEFIATHIGPDAARTSYAVNRGRPNAQQVENAPIEAPDPTLPQKPSPRPMTL